MRTQAAALSLLDQLLNVPSPSGREGAMAALLYEKVLALGLSPEIDSAGNVLVRVDRPQPDLPLCCLASHIDEIAMIVHKVEPNGDLRVGASGGLLPWKLGEGPVELLGDGERDEPLIGVLSMGSTHVRGAGQRSVGWEDVRIMTGLSPAQLDERGIGVGAMALPVRARRGPWQFGDAGDPLLGAWTFDDRLGVVVLLLLLQQLSERQIEPNFPLLIAFTTAEEIGGAGAKSLALRERPDWFIAIDGCPITPEAELALDGRPGLWRKDRLASYDLSLITGLQTAARQAGTEAQLAIYDSAASDASLVHYAGLAPQIGCFGHVRANSHGFEVLRLSVIENVVNTLLHFVGAA